MACQAKGLLINEGGQQLDTGHLKSLLSTIHPLLVDKTNPRVQANALHAAVDFVQECSFDLVEPFLDELIATVLKELPTGPVLVRDAALSFISSAANEMITPGFAKYYSDAMVAIHVAMAASANEKSPALYAEMLCTMARVWHYVV